MNAVRAIASSGLMVRTTARALGLGASTLPTQAPDLPLPANLTGLNTPAGKRLLLESEAHEAFFALSSQFVTQQSQTYCGIASLVMVLNALGVPAPAAPEFKPFRIFTQDNVFNVFAGPVRAMITARRTSKRGMSLVQLADMLSVHPVTTELRQAGDSSLEAFRAHARVHLGCERHFVIVNYLRDTIGQDSGGHTSPLAAYHEGTDQFLILDVARYKYPPAWVKAADLFAAMNTVASPSTGRTRGYLLVSGPPPDQPADPPRL